MKKLKKSWIALLLGALLLATLAGVVWARPKGHHGGYHYTATIPGGHFHPQQGGYVWVNNNNYIWMSSGNGYFTAMVPMLPGRRTVESMTLYVMDNNAGANACVNLERMTATGTKAIMANACSSGASGSVRSFIDTSISPSTIWGGHGASLWLSIQGTSVSVYSVQIDYY